MKISPAFVGAMSGSTGGVTASRNRYGQYMRRRAAPVNPSTDMQSVARGRFTAAVAGWLQLSDYQRAGWKTWADNTPRIDALGNSIVITGQNAYIGASTICQLINANDPATMFDPSFAPTTFNRGVPLNRLILSEISPIPGPPVSATARMVFTSDDELVGDEGAALLFLGRPQNHTRNFFKGPYQFAAYTPYIGTDTAVQFDIDSATADRFALRENANTPYRVVVASIDNRIPIALEGIATWQI